MRHLLIRGKKSTQDSFVQNTTASGKVEKTKVSGYREGESPKSGMLVGLKKNKSRVNE
jgi:hypothetical protein